MAKNQGKTETEEAEPWIGDDVADFTEATAEPVPPAKGKLITRHKIEELIEERRLRRQLGDYEALDLDDERPRRVH